MLSDYQPFRYPGKSTLLDASTSWNPGGGGSFWWKNGRSFQKHKDSLEFRKITGMVFQILSV